MLPLSATWWRPIFLTIKDGVPAKGHWPFRWMRRTIPGLDANFDRRPKLTCVGVVARRKNQCQRLLPASSTKFGPSPPPGQAPHQFHKPSGNVSWERFGGQSYSQVNHGSASIAAKSGARVFRNLAPKWAPKARSLTNSGATFSHITRWVPA